MQNGRDLPRKPIDFSVRDGGVCLPIRQMSQGHELVEGQAILTSESSFAKPTEDRSRASSLPRIRIDTAKLREEPLPGRGHILSETAPTPAATRASPAAP